MKPRLNRPLAWIQPKADPQLIELIERHGITLNARKNSILAHEGDPPNKIFLLCSGLCRHTFSQINDSTITFSLILPQRVIGDISVLASHDFFLRFETIQPSTLKYIPKSLLLRELKKDNEFIFRLAANITNKHHSYLEGMLCNTTLSCEERLFTLFNVLAQEEGNLVENGFIRLPIRLSQDLMSEVVSSSRVSINRAIRRWFNEGHLYKKNAELWVSADFILKKC